MPDSDSFRAAIRHAIAADRQNARKFDLLKDWFHNEFGVDRDTVGPKLLTAGKQLSNRIRKELAELNPVYVVLVMDAGRDFELASVLRQLDATNLPRAKCTLVLDATTPEAMYVYERDNVVDELSTMVAPLVPQSRARPSTSTAATTGVPASTIVGAAPSIVGAGVVVEDRIRRMVRLSIVSNPATILVGPPGTGKSRLLMEVVAEIQGDPSTFGFTKAINEPLVVTPQESWTNSELLGGDSVDAAGTIRFRPGYVLEAIREDRWVVLDEANRADMDKIFGGLLTWLAGQRVELGKVGNFSASPSVILDRTDSAACTVENEGQLAEPIPSGDDVRFCAGSEWRMLGTYNFVDAQRVFRFGEAMGRRFARVPVPPASVAQFRTAAEAVVGSDYDWLVDAIVDIYAAHLKDPATALGPALFLRMPQYVRAGAAGLGGEWEPTPEVAADASSGEGGSSGEVTSVVDASAFAGSADEQDTTSAAEAADGPADTEDVLTPVPAGLRALLVEGYLVNVGAWLSRLDTDTLGKLQVRLVGGKGVFNVSEWEWLVDLVRNLG
jgi:hypothetical protein